MGYLMRSRRYNKPQESSFQSLLQSHDESSELMVTLLDVEEGPGAPLQTQPTGYEQKDAPNAPAADGIFSDGALMDHEGEESLNESWNLPSRQTMKRSLSTEELAPGRKDQTQFLKAAVFGGINAVAGIPALVR